MSLIDDLDDDKLDDPNDPPKDPDDPPKPPEGGDLPDEVEIKLSKEQFEAIPENFRKDGEVLLDSLVKSWGDQQKVIMDKGYAKPEAPEDAKDYVFEPVDDDMKANAAKALKVDEELGEDPVIHAFRDFAKDKGMPQELFQDIVGWFVNKQGAAMEDPIDRKAEEAALGDEGPKIRQYIANVRQTLRANGTMDDAMAEELKLVTMTAAGTKLAYALLGFGKERVVVPNLEQTNVAAKREEIQKKIADLQTARQKGEIPESAANRQYEELIAEMEKIVGKEAGGTSVVFTD